MTGSFPTQASGDKGARSLPYVLVILAPLLWAGNFVIGRALFNVDPFALNFLRWAVAGVCLLPVLVLNAQDILFVLRNRLGSLALLSVLGVVGFNFVLYSGLARTPAGVSGVIFGLTPLLILIVSKCWGGQIITPRMWSGTCLALVGVRARPEWPHKRTHRRSDRHGDGRHVGVSIRALYVRVAKARHPVARGRLPGSDGLDRVGHHGTHRNSAAKRAASSLDDARCRAWGNVPRPRRVYRRILRMAARCQSDQPKARRCIPAADSGVQRIARISVVERTCFTLHSLGLDRRDCGNSDLAVRSIPSRTTCPEWAFFSGSRQQDQAPQVWSATNLELAKSTFKSLESSLSGNC